MTKAEKLFETAKKLMALQSEMAEAIRDVQNDQDMEVAERHMVIDASIDLCSKMFSIFKDENKAFLKEMAERGIFSYADQYIAGVRIEGQTYAPVDVKGYEILNKDDPFVWAQVLRAAAQTDPEVVQKRITDSKVSEEFLIACCGLIATKTVDDEFNWSIKKTK